MPSQDLLDSTQFWAEHGLAGLVIFALFIILGLSIWWAHKMSKESTVAYLSEVQGAREDAKLARTEHYNERVEWRESNERQTDKLEGAFKELSTAINLKSV
jgi:hypothetical protein